MTRLDAAKIKRSLTASTAKHIHRIEVFSKINSTNTYLKGQLSPPPGQFRVAIAEHQTAGRGRQDRQWISTPGGSLCLSLSYRFPQSSPGFSELSALTLALGIAVANALSGIGVAGVRLKWPNDLLVGDAKLGGILTETVMRGDSDVMVIVGIGLNIELSPDLSKDKGAAWVLSATCLGAVMSEPPSMEALSEIVIEALISTCRTFAISGFAEFSRQYPDYDWLAGKTVVVDTPDGVAAGTATGIAADGALLVDTESGRREIHAGTIKRVDDAVAGQ